MKNMKRTMLLALCLVLAVSLTGCGGDPLKGKWELTGLSGGESVGLDAASLELVRTFGGKILLVFADGRMEIQTAFMGEAETQSVGYKLQGTTVIFSDGSENMTYSLSGDELRLSEENGVTMTLTRVKE